MGASNTSKFNILGDQETGYLKLEHNNYLQVMLPTRQKLLSCVDSGGSKSIISQVTIAKSEYLSKLKQTKVQPIRFTVAGHSIQFEFHVQNHKFKMSAYVVPNIGTIDLIIGNDTLTQL